MGMFNVTCGGGCSCVEATVDSWHKSRSSQEYWAYLPVTYTGAGSMCRLSVTGLEESHTGEHKHRLSSALVMCQDPENVQALWQS